MLTSLALLCLLSLCLNAALAVKLAVITRSLRSIADDIERITGGTTNLLLSCPTRDRSVRRLASRLNVSLEELREKRQLYERGDRELRAAITGASHDIRTPLTAINGYLELLSARPLTGESRRYVEIMQARARELGSLTEELFRYSVTASGQRPLTLKQTDLRDVVEDSLAAAYAQLTEACLTPAVALPQVPVRRRTDPELLERVITNLLNNAARHGSPPLTVALDESGTVTVTNAAPNLTQLDVERLFDRFYTVSAIRRTTGLGLSIARTLTARLGGTLSAELRDGLLTLTVSLPRSP